MRATDAPKNKGAEPALGRSRGGFSTKIHVLADRRGRPLRLRVTGGGGGGGSATTAPKAGPCRHSRGETKTSYVSRLPDLR